MKEIVKIDLRKIDSFKDHPFKVENGLLNPLVVKKKKMEDLK